MLLVLLRAGKCRGAAKPRVKRGCHELLVLAARKHLNEHAVYGTFKASARCKQLGGSKGATARVPNAENAPILVATYGLAPT